MSSTVDIDTLVARKTITGWGQNFVYVVFYLWVISICRYTGNISKPSRSFISVPGFAEFDGG